MVLLFPTCFLSSKSLWNVRNFLYSSFEMHKQSQRQKGTKIRICCFKELLEGSTEFRTPYWWPGHAVHSAPPHSLGEPEAAQALALPDLLCLCVSLEGLYLSWQSQRGNSAPIPTPPPRHWLHHTALPPPRPPPTNPSHTLTVCSILHTPATCWDVEQWWPQDRPLG